MSANPDRDAGRYPDPAIPPEDLSAEEARRLVATLVERMEAARLAELATCGGRHLAKEARRGLHVLRTRGVAAEAPRSPVSGAPVRAAADEPEAWASAPTGQGSRLVAVASLSAGGGFDVVLVGFDDEVGLEEVTVLRGPRKILRDVKRHFSEQRHVWAQVPLGHALGLVEEAYERTRSLGRAPPKEYAAARQIFGAFRALRPGDEHPALAEVAPASSPTPADLAGLHALPELQEWIAPRAVLEALEFQLEEVDTSRLLLDDRQRADARRAAVDRAVEATFAGDERARWHRRLCDAAYVYARAGHSETAALLRAQAERLATPDFRAVDDAFARQLVEKLLVPELCRSAIEAPPGTPQEGGGDRRIIVTP